VGISQGIGLQLGSLTCLCAATTHTPSSSGTGSRWGAAKSAAAGSLAGRPKQTACAAWEDSVCHSGAASAFCRHRKWQQAPTAAMPNAWPAS